jgi:hypothetical protein
MKRIQPVTVLLLALIVVLGYSLVTRQRREARLREALALYKERATRQIADIMDWAIGLDWPDDTPLGEAIEVVKASIPEHTGLPKGPPLLIDPDGLREAGQSLKSPVKAPPPDDPNGKLLSMREKLRIILEPLGLAAEVKNGAIIITSRRRADEALAADGEE